MNLKQKVFTLAAATAMSLSIAAPAMAAPQQSNNEGPDQVPVVVSVADVGKFDVFFSSGTLNFGSANLHSDSPEETLNSSFTISYVDTKAFRPNFNVQVAASDFHGQTNSGDNTISAKEFKITGTSNVQQGHCGGPTRPVTSGCYSPVEYGDIGYFVNGAYPSSQATFTAWETSNTLNDPRTVHFGYEGVGTTWAWGGVEASLHVPVGTAEDNYQTTLTLTVIPGTQ